jgi:DNA-binding GntR family transcriptional regulator
MPSETVNPLSAGPSPETIALARRDDASLVQEVYDRILLQIIRGELASGTPLRSTLLARQLGVSRTPVVQALQRLAADGLVLLRKNKRAIVRPGAENWLVELHELRELLEPAAAARAAGRLTPEDLARLEHLAQAAQGDRDGWLEAAAQFDFELHLTIADRSGNFALRQMLRKIWSFKRISYLAAPERPENLRQGYHEHLAILAALKAGDAETARAAMLFHLRSAGSLRGGNIV